MSEPNYALHDYLLQAVGPEGRVLELGSGEGTKNLVKMFSKVYTVEHSESWFNKIPKEAEGIYAPLVKYTNTYYRDAVLWYDPEVLEEKLPKAEDYDAIIVDGPKGSHGRGGFDSHFNLFNQKCLILFDDVHRLWDYRLAGRIAQKKNRDLIVKTGTTGYHWFAVC